MRERDHPEELQHLVTGTALRRRWEHSFVQQRCAIKCTDTGEAKKTGNEVVNEDPYGEQCFRNHSPSVTMETLHYPPGNK